LSELCMAWVICILKGIPRYLLHYNDGNRCLLPMGSRNSKLGLRYRATGNSYRVLTTTFATNGEMDKLRISGFGSKKMERYDVNLVAMNTSSANHTFRCVHLLFLQKPYTVQVQCTGIGVTHYRSKTTLFKCLMLKPQFLR
jgi:hypothetical protein